MTAPFAGKWVKVTDQPPPWKPSDKVWEWVKVPVLPWYKQLFCKHYITHFAPPSERYCEKCGKYITTIVMD